MTQTFANRNTVRKKAATAPVTPAAPAAVPRNAAQTRERILAAARSRFSQHSFETVGTREIAADAGVDAALVIRYFGNKQQLFAEVIEGGFVLGDQLSSSLGTLGESLVQRILAEPKTRAKSSIPAAFDALGVLLRATGNPPIAALVSDCFHAEFVRPLAKLLRGRDAELRATLIASYLIGLATMRHGLDSPALAGPARKKAAAAVAAAIQACVSP